jgi:hypothetical protein
MKNSRRLNLSETQPQPYYEHDVIWKETSTRKRVCIICIFTIYSLLLFVAGFKYGQISLIKERPQEIQYIDGLPAADG